MGRSDSLGEKIVIKSASTALLLMFSVSVTAESVELPHKFVNGEVADADQVNENLSALASGINNLSDRVQNIEATAAGNTEQSLRHGEDLSYTSIRRAPGTVIQYNHYKGSTLAPETTPTYYVITRVPFKEFGSGRSYAITFPQPYETVSDGIGKRYETEFISEHQIAGDDHCSDAYKVITIQEARVCVFPRETRRVWMKDYTNTSTDAAGIVHMAELRLEMLVGETLITLGYEISKSEYNPRQTSDPNWDLADFDWDFTRAFDTKVMDHYPVEEWFYDLDSLINEIYIERLEVD